MTVMAGYEVVYCSYCPLVPRLIYGRFWVKDKGTLLWWLERLLEEGNCICTS